MSRFQSPNIHCENEWGKMKFGVAPTQKQKDDFFSECKKDYSESIEKFNQRMYGEANTLQGLTIISPQPAIKPSKSTIPAEPKVEVADIKVEKNEKLDTNQVLLLGLGAIIVILILKK